MSDPVREQLLGYVLGALDEPEQQALEATLADDAGLQQELAALRRRLEPLHASREEFSPPEGLAPHAVRGLPPIGSKSSAARSAWPAPRGPPRQHQALVRPVPVVRK